MPTDPAFEAFLPRSGEWCSRAERDKPDAPISREYLRRYAADGHRAAAWWLWTMHARPPGVT